MRLVPFISDIFEPLILFPLYVIKPDGNDMLISYSSLEDRAGFVPEVATDEAPYPFIGKNIFNIFLLYF